MTDFLKNIKQRLILFLMPFVFLLSIQSLFPLNVDSPALYPEGVTYDSKRDLFLITSLRKGIVSRVNHKGKATPFFKNPKIISAVGIKYDTQRDRVVVCGSDPGVGERTSPATLKKTMGVAIFRASDGKLIKFLELNSLNAGPNFSNDLTFDDAGNIYVTDSFSPIVFKIDMNYRASIFLKNKRFEGNGFNLNGIVYHKDGYLIVAKSNEGALFKIPLSNPEEYQQIQVDKNLVGADGLVFVGHRLAVVSNSQNKVFLLSSTDHWKQAHIEEQYEGKILDFPTTATVAKGDLYIMNAKLGHLFGGDRSIGRFEILNVKSDLQRSRD